MAGKTSYAALRQELDNILTQLQDPACDVDKAAALYGQAVATIKSLEKHIAKAENNVQKIQADLNSDGVVD